MNTDEVMDFIKKHEGYRRSIYVDTVGVPTGGYGHAFLRDSRLPHHIWETIFWNDYYNVLQDYEKLDLTLDTVRKAVILDMLFNLGLTKLKRFRNLLAAIKREDWKAAKKSMLSSKWARQVKRRAVEDAEMMLTGKYKEE